jgi:glycerol-3-phosphate O-acyltransferase/dihydroxyacetone phosphate acyltransferase
LWGSSSASCRAVSTFDQHVVERSSEAFCEVPVSRAQDDAKPGSGCVCLDENDPCLVRGEGTSFMAEFTPKMQIMLPKSLDSVAAEVAEVISDTELKIKREFGGENGTCTSNVRDEVAKTRKTGSQGLPFRRLPYVNQETMFRYVYRCLQDGGCIGIFPEGSFTPRCLCSNTS